MIPARLKALFRAPSAPTSTSGPAGRLRLEVPETLPACTALLCADGARERSFLESVAARDPGAVILDDDLALPPARSVESLLRARARGDGETLTALVAGLQLELVLDEPPEALDPIRRRRVVLALLLLEGRAGPLLVGAIPGLPSRERSDLLACLRWLSAARRLRVVYGIQSTADLEDLADALVVVDEQGRTFGPEEPWTLLGATWRGALTERLDVVSTLAAKVDYLDEEGRWLRVLSCGEREIYLPFQRLSPGWLGRIAVRPESVLVVHEPIPGPRLTNQVPGRVAAVGDLLGRCLVSVDVGDDAPLRALVEPDTVREQGFSVGARVVCVFEPAAVRWSGAVS